MVYSGDNISRSIFPSAAPPTKRRLLDTPLRYTPHNCAPETYSNLGASKIYSLASNQRQSYQETLITPQTTAHFPSMSLTDRSANASKWHIKWPTLREIRAIIFGKGQSDSGEEVADTMRIEAIEKVKGKPRGVARPIEKIAARGNGDDIGVSSVVDATEKKPDPVQYRIEDVVVLSQYGQSFPSEQKTSPQDSDVDIRVRSGTEVYHSSEKLVTDTVGGLLSVLSIPILAESSESPAERVKAMWPESKAAAPASSATANVNYKQPIPSQFEEPSLPSDVIVLEKYDELEKENKLRAERISEIVRDVSDIKPLSDDELRRIGKYWTCANDSVTISSKFNLDVTARDLKTLRNGKWLNDTVIDFYLSLLTDRCMKKGSKLPKSFAFTTHFFSTLKAKGHAGVARWAKRKKVDVTKMDYVFVPMNIQNAHWALAVINNKERRFQYYDSMRGLSSMDALNRLCDYMTDESKRLGVTGIDYTEYEMDADVPAPRQENGYDCGVFTCTNVEYLSRGAKLTFKQSDMQNLRNKMALEVLQGELLQNE